MTSTSTSAVFASLKDFLLSFDVGSTFASVDLLCFFAMLTRPKDVSEVQDDVRSKLGFGFRQRAPQASGTGTETRERCAFFPGSVRKVSKVGRSRNGGNKKVFGGAASDKSECLWPSLIHIALRTTAPTFVSRSEHHP